MKSTRFIYDQLRDIYTLICEEEIRKKPAAPIKKKPTYQKTPYIKYGSGYADQGRGGSRIRTTTKDWDEAVEQPTRRKTLKEFRADAGGNTTPLTTRDKKNQEFMHQVFLAGKNIDDFELFIDFVNHLL